MAAALPIIAIGTMLAGTAMSAGSQLAGGRAQKAGYEYGARVAEADATVARQKAAREEEIHRGKLSRLMGTQRAVFGAAGVDIGEGTPLSIAVDTMLEGEREAEFIRYGGEVEATRSLNEARMQRYYGKQAVKAGRIGAASTFLTGLGQAGMMYAGMGKGATPKTGYEWGGKYQNF